MEVISSCDMPLPKAGLPCNSGLGTLFAVGSRVSRSVKGHIPYQRGSLYPPHAATDGDRPTKLSPARLPTVDLLQFCLRL